MRIKQFIILGAFLALGCLSENVMKKKNSSSSSGGGSSNNKAVYIYSAYPPGNKDMAQDYASDGDYYYSLTTDQSTITHSISVSDSGNLGYSIKWFIDGVQKSTATSNTYPISPSTFATSGSQHLGIHTVTVQVLSTNGLTLYEQKKWVINLVAVSENDFKITFAGVTPSEFFLEKNLGDANISFSVIISDPLHNGYHYKWYLNNTMISNPGANAAATATYSLPLSSNTLSEGSHVMELKIRDSTYTTTLRNYSWVIKLSWSDLLKTPAVSTPATGGLIRAYAGKDINYWNYIPKILVSDTGRSDGGSGIGVQIQFYLNGQSIGSATDVGTDKTLSLSSVTDALPYLTFTPNAYNTSESYLLSAGIIDVASGGTIGDPLYWKIIAVPENVPAAVSVISPVSSYAIGEATPANYSVSVEADATAVPTVKYYLGGSEIDVKPTCYTSATSDLTTSTTCTLYQYAFTPFNEYGPVDPSSPKIMQAVASNSGGLSSTNTWTIQLTEMETEGAQVDTSCQTGACTPSIQSFLADSSTSNDFASAKNEGETIYFNINTHDIERDHYKYKIYYNETSYGVIPNVVSACSDADNWTAITSDWITVRRTNSDLYFMAPDRYVYNITESVVNGNLTLAKTPSNLESSKTVYFKIATEDIPNTVTPTPEKGCFQLLINDVNPTPYYSGTSPTPAVIGATFDVVTGFPITINPNSTVLDNSNSTDTVGSTIKYNWQYIWPSIVGDSYKQIALGDSYTSLYWAPPPPSTPTPSMHMNVRLCVGDYGYSQVSEPNCTPAETGITWVGPNGTPTAGVPSYFLDVHNAEQRIFQTIDFTPSAATNSLTVASIGDIWLPDTFGSPTARDLFVALPFYDGVDNRIRLNKINFGTDADLSGISGDTEGSDLLRFKTDANNSTNDATDMITLGGDDDYLWVVYVIQDSEDLGTATNVLRMKKTSRSNLKTGENTLQDCSNCYPRSLGNFKYFTGDATNYWYVPYVNMSQSNRIDIAYSQAPSATMSSITNLTSDGTNSHVPSGSDYTVLNDIISNVDAGTKDYLLLAYFNSSGDINLYAHELNSANGAINSSANLSETSVFGESTVSNPTMIVTKDPNINGENTAIYMACKYTSGSDSKLKVIRLTGFFSGSTTKETTDFNLNITNLKAAKLTPMKNTKTNIYSLLATGDESDATGQLVKVIWTPNATPTVYQSATSLTGMVLESGNYDDSFQMSPYYYDLPVGNFISESEEANKKDILFILYKNKDSLAFHSVLVNGEVESNFSASPQSDMASGYFY